MRVVENDFNKEIPPQVREVKKHHQGAQAKKVPIGGQRNDVPMVTTELSNSYIREAFLALVRAVTT